jgi:hypothetical protein
MKGGRRPRGIGGMESAWSAPEVDRRNEILFRMSRMRYGISHMKISQSHIRSLLPGPGNADKRRRHQSPDTIGAQKDQSERDLDGTDSCTTTSAFLNEAHSQESAGNRDRSVTAETRQEDALIRRQGAFRFSRTPHSPHSSTRACI